MLDQADAVSACNYVLADSDLAGDLLIARLGVVAFVVDRTLDIDAASAHQVGDAALGKGGTQHVVYEVILNDRAVWVGAAVQAGSVAVGGVDVAVQADHCNGLAKLA